MTSFLVRNIPGVAPYSPLPSSPMIIRRYRSLDEKKYLDTYFTEGLFCNRLTEFEDDNEGLLERMATDATIKGTLAAGSARETDVASDEEFRSAFDEYHKDAQFQHYANCWRIGSDESERIWKRYTEENMVEGCALETTVGQLMSTLPVDPIDSDYETGESYNEGSDFGDIHKTPPEGMSIDGAGNDIRAGACRYQRRMDPDSVQPGGWRASVAFFKGEDFDIENEFRLLLNPYSSNTQINTADDGTPYTFRPDSSTSMKFPIDMQSISNKVILAPEAGKEQIGKIKRWLRGYYDSATARSRELPILRSPLSEEKYRKNYEYISELGGLDNYRGTFREVFDVVDEFIEKRNWNRWPLLDVVLIHTDNSGAIVEAYWHKTKEPPLEFEHYGYDEFQNVAYMRFDGPDSLVDAQQNENAEETDAFDFDITSP